ncbi:MAG: bifunctional diaminohydroxyphosphoribosylaminopyrimidine deaminase/5-amino-6-(5-phosphoribosylamino)uracil reductase RibD [Alphaproteobacteria bacterium]|jgi:diaminohydroxyphosphoribosylaminopyrimidine deaminase/5-amino-6-(5-phosphoribosylamino)uracil reductase
MALALRLAQRSLGRVWPNPAVGCVIVDAGGHVAGQGWTQDGGRPHAETEAIRQAGARARGGVAYVTLEPCAHHGQTGPCAEALVSAGVARVVSATEDPDPRVAGRGHARLVQAGIAVDTGVLGGEARHLNAGFLSRIMRGRPLVTLKVATTLDGRIAMTSGESKWITGPEARAHAHLMRAQHDAVLAGIGTVLADDPELSCRLDGIDHRRLVRVVFDTRARLPEGSRLCRSADRQAVWLLTAQPDAAAHLARANVRVLPVAAAPEGIDPLDALRVLAAEGLTRVLVEGGAQVVTSLLRARLADRLAWYRSPAIMGQGVAAFSGLGLSGLADMPRVLRKETRVLGQDLLETCEFDT